MSDKETTRASPQAGTGWLVGGGEMGNLVRSMDWSRSPLGPIASWPESLRTTVNLALASNFPISIAWGPHRVQIYNDGYWPICGGKHPESMGQDFKECWLSAWPAVGEAFESAWAGKTAFLENQRMFLDRHGYLEETFFTFSFSPIRDETGRVAGLFHPVTEMTAQTLAERRLGVLREVSDESADARTLEEASELIFRALGRHQLDVPFAVLYLVDRDGKVAHLVKSAHLDPGSPAAPQRVSLDSKDAASWPLAEAIRTDSRIRVDRLEERFGAVGSGPYPESPRIAMVLPISVAGLAHPLGALVLAVSPRRGLDHLYHNLYVMLQEAVANSLVNARLYEEEKKRAEALAELDRAKTTFFSNVSHEFRTPLTLMLSPLEDALASSELPPAARDQLVVAHRNSLRLLKLVNSLLEFSRIEAGRVQASYQPTDLASLTENLASNFRSACEKASLDLRVDCPPLSESIYVDRDMWEKIVLNLLSNAFKYTFEGEIEVTLRETGESAVLRVRDTGTGIPSEELPHLFERFHRVEGAGGRTHEGTGIGLALAEELVKLHGGKIEVESAPARGTTFTVTVPRGRAHLPEDRVDGARTLTSTATGAAPYVEEALRWLPDGSAGARRFDEDTVTASTGAPATPASPPASGAEALSDRILVVDDNADMRDYARRLLSPRFEVLTAPDGEIALALARRSPPDLVIADVMMPGLDGFELLRVLRAEEHTQSIPVILLSARAGEEARVEGLEAGADDYLVKPFSARELLARVETHLRMAKIRRESERRFREFADAAPTMLWIADAENRCTFLSRGWSEFTGQTEGDGLGFGWLDSVHPDDRKEVDRGFGVSSVRREPFSLDYRLRRADGEYRWVINAGRPRFDEKGTWLGYIGSVIDVHERKEAEEAFRRSQDRLRSVANNVPALISHVDSDGHYRFANAQYLEWFGASPESIVGRHVRDVIGPDAYEQRRPYLERVIRGERLRFEGPTPHRRLGLRDTELVYIPDLGPEGEVRGFYVQVVDITERKRTEAALRRQSERLRILWDAAGVILTSDDPDTMLKGLFAKVSDHLEVDTYFNFMLDESGAALHLVSYAGISEEEARRITRLEFGQAICGTVALRRKPIIATYIQHSDDPRVLLVKGYGLRAYACNPLLVGERLLGTLSFSSRTRDEFSPDEIAFLETISQYVTAAYEQMRLIAELREADRRKDEFLATLAHELRNPLAPILTGLHVARMATDDPAVLRKTFGTMERQTKQLARLIDDLLDVSRITQGRLQVRKVRVEIKEVIRSAVEAARPSIDEAGQELSVTLPDRPVFLEADVTRLSQVFSNLLSNAAKYTPEGGRIELTVRRDGTDLVGSVKDNGIGITRDMLGRIFEMFVQVDRYPEKDYTGLGIGLTLVKSLVEMHDGTITVRSDGPGRGSEFIVRLPAVAESPSLPPPRAPAEPSTAGKARRVLVVDDNQAAAELLSLAVRMLGNDVRTASDGLAAVEIASEFRPDVVLMDIGMPRMNGYDAARRIRAEPWGKEVTLVALTGWGQDEDKRKTSEAGFDHHLVKPVEPAAIEEIFRGLRVRN